MSEAADARAILRMLLEYPSSLGKKELARLKESGWKLLAEENANLAEIKNIIARLMEGRKKKQGRPTGSVAKNRHETDWQVFERIASGSTTEAAIRGVYGDEGFEGHEKRIKRRKQTMRKLAELASRHPEGGQ